MHKDRSPGFEVPSSNEKVWRYMDLAKFISLIDRKELFFSSVDVFGDPYEGVLPDEIESIIAKRRYGASDRSEYVHSVRRGGKPQNSSIFVNSWHLSEFESAAMWAIYSKFDSGIAIQSSFKRLQNSFKDSPYKIYLSKVNYIDYSNAQFDLKRNFMLPFIHKRKSFAYENELRVLALVPPKKGVDGRVLDQQRKNIEDGVYVPVELNELIERVYVSPKAPGWLGELVESIVRRFGHSKYKVVISRLYSLG